MVINHAHRRAVVVAAVAVPRSCKYCVALFFHYIFTVCIWHWNIAAFENLYFTSNICIQLMNFCLTSEQSSVRDSTNKQTANCKNIWNSLRRKPAKNRAWLGCSRRRNVKSIFPPTKLLVRINETTLKFSFGLDS